MPCCAQSWGGMCIVFKSRSRATFHGRPAASAGARAREDGDERLARAFLYLPILSSTESGVLGSSSSS